MTLAAQRVQSGAIRWHVRVAGSGPPALFLHGTGASGHSFDALAERLASRFTVVVPDVPGHGFTEAPRGFLPSVSEMAAAASELLSVLEIRPSVLVGHSAGAAIVTRMILDRTEAPALAVGIGAALVPLRGIAKATYARAARVLSLASRFVALPVPNVDRIVRSTGSRLADPALADYRRLARRPEHVSGVLAMMANWEIEPLYRELPTVDVPFLFIAGKRDRAVPVIDQRVAAARVGRGQLCVIENAGHLVHEEHPATVADAITTAFEGALS